MRSKTCAAFLLPVVAFATSAWKPHFEIQGAYDGPLCEATPFFWPKDKKMYLMESVCRGPLDVGHGKFGGSWSHAEVWDPQYLGHSYIRIRDMATGTIVSNLTHSIGFGFGAAFVDYDHGTLWISATPNDRANKTAPRPYGPKHDFSCGHYECGVWVFNTTDLMTWTRTKTDIDPTLGTPNTDIGRVYAGPHPVPVNLPPHRYVMATERGRPWIVNNNANGDLTQGWSSLPAAAAAGGVSACPSVRYLPSDGFYYTVSGGHTVALQRSRDLLTWEASKTAAPFLQSSPADVRTASAVMASAADNLRRSSANLSFPNRSAWDRDSNDADLCCESWGGASPEHGGPAGSYVAWGADGQGSTRWTDGPEGFAVIATANVTLEKLLQSYF